MTIKKVGALITMTVSTEENVEAVLLQQRDEVSAEGDLRRVDVRVVRAPTVGRMMAIGDEPLIGVGFEVTDEPAIHRAIG